MLNIPLIAAERAGLFELFESWFEERAAELVAGAARSGALRVESVLLSNYRLRDAAIGSNGAIVAKVPGWLVCL